MKHDVNMAPLQYSLLLGGTNSTSLSINDVCLDTASQGQGRNFPLRRHI